MTTNDFAEQINILGTRAVAKYLNAHGGLAGRKVVVDFYDSKLAGDETRNAIIAKGVEMERRLSGLCLALETTRGNILSIKGAVAPGVVAYDEWLRVVDEALQGGAK